MLAPVTRRALLAATGGSAVLASLINGLPLCADAEDTPASAGGEPWAGYPRQVAKLV